MDQGCINMSTVYELHITKWRFPTSLSCRSMHYNGLSTGLCYQIGSQYLEYDGWIPNHVPNLEDKAAMVCKFSNHLVSRVFEVQAASSLTPTGGSPTTSPTQRTRRP